jgi:3-deoxy-D-manno-octulosonic-acid transferase
MRHVYSALFTCLLPLIILRMLWRSRLAPAYRRRLGERLAWFPPLVDGGEADRPLVWIHAVSLGETLAARPLIDALLAGQPSHRLLVTTTTPTGSERIRALFGDRVHHVYAPWDTPGAVRRFLRRCRPKVLVLMETELWPNLLHYCQRDGCRVILANARLSARSAAGYARVGALTRPMMHNLDAVAAQSAADGERFVELGLASERLAICGSIKFDVSLDEALRDRAAALRQRWNLEARPVCLVASTHRGEDAIAVDLYQRLRRVHGSALLLLAPRHPERFDEVVRLCRDAGLAVQRRSEGGDLQADTQVLVIDTLGELLLLFGIADIAVIGGSFIPNGGHNPLEAAVWGVPVLTGPSMFNFADVTERLAAAGALEQVRDADALAHTACALVSDQEERLRRGRAGQRVVEESRGALPRIAALIEEQLAASTER